MVSDETLRSEIEQLKQARRAVILVHNYQPGALQDIGDFVGDSLELSRQAAETAAEVILFCGVHFMAETAAILSPSKTVVMPRLDAGCPMANMIDPAGLARLRAEHPAAHVVCYVNSTAAVKAASDITCTSANAAKVVESFPADAEIIFAPDQYLGAHVEGQTGRRLIRWPGFCPVHAAIRREDMTRARTRFSGAELWAHPECMPEVTRAADFVLSTGGMVRRARETNAEIVVVATELGMLYRLGKERPDVTFVPATEQAICVNMKLATLADARDALGDMKNIVAVPEDIRVPAARAVERMLAIR